MVGRQGSVESRDIVTTFELMIVDRGKLVKTLDLIRDARLMGDLGGN